MKRSEFVLGALSVAFVGCTKATFETPKNLTRADEAAIRAWVQGL